MKQSSSVQIIGNDSPVDHRHSVSCAGCMLKGSCFPIGMDVPDVTAFNSIVQRARPLHKGEFVYRDEQPFTAVYAVRSGAFKAYKVSEDGEEQIAQFYLPGEIFGMDGLSHNRYATSMIALETSSVCAIPFENLRELSTTLPDLQRYMFQLMSQAIVADQEMIALLGKYSAERRIATLLLRISRHQASRKLSASKLRLPMSRTEIGCYLGLTVETVSRIFSRFQKIGLLNLENREVEIMSVGWLCELANGGATSQSAPVSSPSLDGDNGVIARDVAKVVRRRSQVGFADRAAARVS